MSNVAVAASNPASYQATTGSRRADDRTRSYTHQETDRALWHGRTRFPTSLTELEATGMRAVSAQSIATGKSLELAQQECANAAETAPELFRSAIPNTFAAEGNLRTRRLSCS